VGLLDQILGTALGNKKSDNAAFQADCRMIAVKICQDILTLRVTLELRSANCLYRAQIAANIRLTDPRRYVSDVR
jgi:hypothetical protein